MYIIWNKVSSLKVSSQQNWVSKKSFLLSGVTWGLMLLSDNLLDLHAKILSLPVGVVKYLKND